MSLKESTYSTDNIKLRQFGSSSEHSDTMTWRDLRNVIDEMASVNKNVLDSPIGIIRFHDGTPINVGDLTCQGVAMIDEIKRQGMNDDDLCHGIMPAWGFGCEAVLVYGDDECFPGSESMFDVFVDQPGTFEDLFNQTPDAQSRESFMYRRMLKFLKEHDKVVEQIREQEGEDAPAMIDKFEQWYAIQD